MSVPRKRAATLSSLRVAVVTNYEQLLHAYAIRSICFIEENGFSAHQSYDGNDYQATHIIVYYDEEPIGAVRIRWFRSFAKIERSCFLKSHRHPDIIKTAANFVFDHAARKGYRRIITHASPKYARFWRIILGFRLAGKRPVWFVGQDEPFVELVKDLVPKADAINPQTPAHILFRVEGHWDAPSAFEDARSVPAPR